MLADIGRIDPPRPRHSEVEDHRVSTICVDESIFGTAAERGNAGARQSLPQVRWEGTAKVGAPRLDPLQPASLEDMLQAADGGFDFGQFGHRILRRIWGVPRPSSPC